eukprot:TRINITY_DN1716_c0_g2_i1.p1 TRINITY_DN1716_c0_g2~~TRINITY_DN1716_c0_g2_i1.p1  ORF type:complete len:160 (-),score=31.10 TRINITY_DN1716_c0_g2_i1:166-582(-)
MARRSSSIGVLAVVALVAVLSGPVASFVGGRSSGAPHAPARVASSVAMQAEATPKEYWEGEWICADCGYIYNEGYFGQKFEDLEFGFKCPACAAPRRRFARKMGDKIGTTLDGGDTPILVFSALALAVVFAIAYLALQ